MGGDEPPRSGIFASLRSLCDSGIALLQNRIKLFSVELEEQKIRFVRLLALVAAAVFLANTAILAITITIIVVVGERARVPVMIGLCVLYSGAALIAFLALRKEIKDGPEPFEGTISEIKRDREWLTRQS
jgi:uncharacterized membrane protein YqjE